MSNTSSSFTVKANENDVMDGINSIINMFETIDQPVFPRNIMCASYNGFFPVYDLKQMYNVFKRSNFQDCRISAYPSVNENSMLIPNLSLLDIDYDDDQVNSNGIIYADQLNKTKVNKILKRLQLKFGIQNFMIMRTGNGRHILIPFLFDTPFEYVQEMRDILPYLISRSHRKINNIMSESFLPFAKNYLSNNQADKGNYPNFASIFLRVPGSINMKMKFGVAEIVQMEYEWSYDKDSIASFGDLHPSTKLFYDFMHYMRLVAGRQLERKYRFKPRTVNRGSIYKSIEFLHDIAISDYRKRVLWLILAPYAVNVRKMRSENAFIWIKQWANKCNQTYPFEPGYNIDQKIDYYITLAEGNGHFPLSLDNLKPDEWQMKAEGKISLSEFIFSKMGNTSVLYDASKGGYQKV
ncbi:MAG: hypothetical protein GEU26_12860 [Nitrososphaeraceae archaeon]|nr:hypothetical protein [Nitrososphaeraceae archaeon]